MTRAGDWVVRAENAHGTCRIRLVCFPHAGGGTSVYRPWIEPLAPEVEVLPVALPGRDSRYREPPATELTQLARAVAEGLRPVLLDEGCPRERSGTPYAFFGHSLGAILAYETVRALRDLAPPPALLIASASVPPHRAAESLRNCHTLPDEEFLTEVVHLGGIPPDTLDEPELVRLMLPVLRADFAVAETYTHTPSSQLDCPLAVYTADADASVSRDQAVEWDRFTQVRPVVHRSFPGDHFYLDGARSHLLGALRLDLLKESP